MREEIKEKLALLPDHPGVYLMHGKDGGIIYVGKAKSLKNRVRSYFHAQNQHTPKVQAMVEQIWDLEWILADTPLEALMLECTLIKKHLPKYNILLKDSKQYPYLRVDVQHAWPRVQITRTVKKDGAHYFGPYGAGWAVREVLDMLAHAYPLRSCNKDIPPTGGHDRPCLKYQIGRCSAPCAGLVSPAEYRGMVQEVERILKGKGQDAVEHLRRSMMEASDKMEFERAALLRDRIRALESVQQKQKAVSTAMEERDVLAVYQQGLLCVAQVLPVRAGRISGGESHVLQSHTEQTDGELLAAFIPQYYAVHPVPREVLLFCDVPERELLEAFLRQQREGAVHIVVPQRGDKRHLCELARDNARAAAERILLERERDLERTQGAMEALGRVLGLEKTPSRIEGFDISHTQGAQQVASMVVFVGGRPARKEYRHFRIKRMGGADDFASMKEVVTRRLMRYRQGDAAFSPLPDVILIDGGPGQLQAALEGMREAGVSVPMFALAKRLEEIFLPGRPDSILLARDDPALHVIERVRDEAHRFAITFHRALRSKASIYSRLEDIPGIGPARRKALLRALGSEAGIRAADIEALAAVPGMTHAAAQAVWQAFHQNHQGGQTPAP
nr:excinuclease ABC subunit UvrC [bacterium]